MLMLRRSANNSVWIASGSRLRLQRGFTLLEMLVVLVIITLVITLLFQSLAYMVALRSRFLGQLEAVQTGALQEYWFRTSTAGLLADHEDIEKPRLFKGQAMRFAGLTLAGLDAMPGVPVPFAWELAEEGQNSVLRYLPASGQAWEVARWSGKAEGFAYLGDEGKWHSQWPPTSGLEPPQLPVAVSLSAQRRQGAFTWVIKLVDLREPRPDFRLMD